MSRTVLRANGGGLVLCQSDEPAEGKQRDDAGIVSSDDVFRDEESFQREVHRLRAKLLEASSSMCASSFCLRSRTSALNR